MITKEELSIYIRLNGTDPYLAQDMWGTLGITGREFLGAMEEYLGIRLEGRDEGLQEGHNEEDLIGAL